MTHNTNHPANDGVSHAQLTEALNKADKVRLIQTVRAMVTLKAWDLTEVELRVMLSDMAHSPKSSHAEVYEALTNGA